MNWLILDNQKLKIGGHILNIDSNYQVWWEKSLQAEQPQDNQNRSINKEPCLTLDPFPFLRRQCIALYNLQ